MKKFVCAALTAGCFISAVAFGGCAVGEANVLYTLSEDGTHYIVSGVEGDKRGLVTYEVPASYASEEGGELLPVTEIGEKAFYQCFYLTELTLPDSIEKVGASAFGFCGFDTFTIPESVTYIGYGAFGACEYLKEITVPKSVTTLAPLAFYGCISLKKAYVKADISVLDDRVFYNTTYEQGGSTYTETSLTSIYLSASVTKIRDTALYGNFITDIYFAGSEEQWSELYFFATVKSEENAEETVEKKYEKNEVLNGGVTVHYNVEF